MADQLIEELKVKIVNILDLANLPSSQLDVDGPLIGGSLALSSLGMCF